MDTFKKQLLVKILVAFLLVSALVVLTQLSASDLKRNSTKIQDQKTELAFRIRATGQLAFLKADSEKAQPLFNSLASILPPKDDLINLGKSVVEIGKNYRLDIGFTFGGENLPAGGAPGFISFGITGAGGYTDFQKFLKDLERSRYYIRINSVDLIRQPSGTSYNIIADGQVFYQ